MEEITTQLLSFKCKSFQVKKKKATINFVITLIVLILRKNIYQLKNLKIRLFSNLSFVHLSR